jgi:hypothetical protein
VHAHNAQRLEPYRRMDPSCLAGAKKSSAGNAHWLSPKVARRGGACPFSGRDLETALDAYATFRSLDREHRESQIADTKNDNRAAIPIWFAPPGQMAR